MLVGFLALLCPHKEVHLRYVKNLKGVQGEFLYKPQDKLPILYYNKKLDTEEKVQWFMRRGLMLCYITNHEPGFVVKPYWSKD